MKLNVIEDADISKEMAPKISEYSNSQNAILQILALMMIIKLKLKNFP